MDIDNLSLQEPALKILMIIFLGVIINWLTSKSLGRGLLLAVKRSHGADDEKFVKDRVFTLSRVLTGAIKVIIYVIVIFMIMQNVGINITPLLTGFGILGLAFGLGAQTVVKDLISGFFIVYDNQFLKGDVIEVNGKTGEVADLSLRRVVIRDWDGIAHIIPNSEIKVVSNYTKGWAKVKIDVGVSSKHKVEKVFEALIEAGKEVKKDVRYRKYVYDEIVPEGIIDLKGDTMVIRISGKVVASHQWIIANELRLKIKEVFEKEKIELA